MNESRTQLAAHQAAFTDPAFIRPSLGGRSSATPSLLTLTLADLAARALHHRPGYTEAVVARGSSQSNGSITIPAATLAEIHRQFRPGCCGE